jgi:crotonobetainyl-CoA:carnitine CoA-transferase CaiB-like acyl-CoA transferase
LSARFPALVYCSLTGYGQTGPWKQRAGHDLNYMAVAGMSSYTGRTGEAPLPLGAQYADIAGGSHHAVMGIPPKYKGKVAFVAKWLSEYDVENRLEGDHVFLSFMMML